MKNRKTARKPAIAPKPLAHGRVVLPDSEGRCGACGAANFDYNNGFEFSADYTRGYRCAVCGAIKPENWRELKSRG